MVAVDAASRDFGPFLQPLQSPAMARVLSPGRDDLS